VCPNHFPFLIFSKLKSLNIYFQRAKLTPFDVHKHYSAVVNSLYDEFVNEENSQYYLKSNKPIALYMRNCMHHLSEQKYVFQFGKREAEKEMFQPLSSSVLESNSIIDKWGCSLTVSMNEHEFVRLTDFINQYSISLAVVKEYRDQHVCTLIQHSTSLEVSPNNSIMFFFIGKI
jgi:hypothetical protein